MSEKQVASWRIILAFILDLITSFAVLGYIVASFTGDTTGAGFSLEGGPAIVLFLLVIVYFVGMNRFAGGTIWKRILKARR